MRQLFTALLSGLFFGSGLTISGMVDPTRVLGFLDILGDWDPTLAFVMAGGLSVYLPIYSVWIKPKQRTVFGESCHIPVNTEIDAKLVAGAALFGLGWGLSGICPGPAITNLSGGQSGMIVFVITMLIGMITAKKFVK